MRFRGRHLEVGDKRVFFRGIRHTDTPIDKLRAAGFNTLFLEPGASREELRQAVDNGFYLVPSLPVAENDSRYVSAQDLERTFRTFPDVEHVLFWNLGNALANEQTRVVADAAQWLHTADKQRPVCVDAWDGLSRYSNAVDLLGVHRWPLATGMELPQYREWLEQRGRLANPDTFLWTWVQTHLPDSTTRLLYDRPAAAGFSEPIGPQPEHLRLLAWIAVGSGYRGITYWSDRFLADSHQGRDRLLTLALVNQELDMLEPLLVQVDNPPVWIGTSSPEVFAAVLRCKNAVLVLPMWIGPGGQFVPGQAAFNKLSLTVPHVPQSWQCWEISPGDTRSYIPVRQPGGSQVTLPEFGLTTALVFTADTNMIIRFQEQARSKRQRAAEWTYDLAVKELEKVERIEAELVKLDHTQPDAAELLQDARARLQTANQHWTARLYSDCYHEAQRALRPVRILMRAQWDKAVKKLSSPVASPYAVTYYTLPRHLEFMRQIDKATPTANLLPGGGFEVVDPGREQVAWAPQWVTLDEVTYNVQHVGQIWWRPPEKDKDGKPKPKPPPSSKAVPLPARKVEPPKEGKQCLMLEIKPTLPIAPPEALERTFLAVNSPAVQLPPGSLVRISGSVLIPDPIKASPDGALFYDSAGGEPLAIRLTATEGWRDVTLYRRVPASGQLHVTVALTGLGTVFFDDIRVEPLVAAPLVTPPTMPMQSVPVAVAN